MRIKLKLAIDTNVICALLNGETAGEAVAEVLEQYQRQGSLVICGQVYGELLVMYPGNMLLSFLNQAGIVIDFAMSARAWSVAAAAWRDYLTKRKKEATRYICSHCGEANIFACQKCGKVLPPPKAFLADFVVGAHALCHADKLFTLDKRGRFYRNYFPGLDVLSLP